MSTLDPERPCPQCGETDRDVFTSGSVQCGDCGLPILERAEDYRALGMTSDGLMLPDLTWRWAPCDWCGLADDRLPDGAAADCQECGAHLIAGQVRVVTTPQALTGLREAARPHEATVPLQVGDSLVVSSRRLVGADPFTRLWVTAVHDDDGYLDLTRDTDGTRWTFVPAEYVFARL